MPKAEHQYCQKGHPKTEENVYQVPGRPGWRCKACTAERMRKYFAPDADPWCFYIKLHCAICGKHYSQWHVTQRGWYFCTFIRGRETRIPVCSQPCRIQWRRLHDERYRRAWQLRIRRAKIQAYKDAHK